MRYTLLVGFFCLSGMLFGQDHLINLWPDEVPNQRATSKVKSIEKLDNGSFYNVQEPTIEVYLPSRRYATGQSIIICPGGSYGRLAYDYEGVEIAKMLSSQGVAGIVLKYRLPNSKRQIESYKVPLMDAEQAVRIVRSKAEEWNIDPNKVGIMGLSAGGHLASTLGTHFSEGTRPDFMVLVYPVVSMKFGITHDGSRNNLLGKNPNRELIEFYSNEDQVTNDTPPTFIVHSSNDSVVTVKNSLLLYDALLKNKVSVEMHIYPEGGHGFGLAIGKGTVSTWSGLLIGWLGAINR